jgi:UDP-GlcNAc:undecaprenyl-phosphate GlcNAc-1-phosphate transferase
MYALIALLIVALVIALVITPLVQRVSRRCGILDQPDAGRKRHPAPIPRTGGVAIAITYVATFAVLLVSPFHVAKVLQSNLSFVWTLLPAAALIFATGLIDDILGLRPWQKLVGEAAAALCAFIVGVRVFGFSEYLLSGWWSLPLTIGWLLLCTNAFNLIDGLDGLAAGTGLFAAATMLVAGLLQNNLALAVAIAPLAGSLIAFLLYNSSPASIFLGDCGSLTIGFLLGCYGCIWSQKSATLLGMTAPVIVLGFPLLDTTLAVVRRFLAVKPIFTADRAHIHHRLLDKGLTPRRVTFVLYSASGVAAGLSLLASMKQAQFSGLVIVVFCIAAWWGIHHLGYIELEVARKVVFQRFRRIMKAEFSVLAFEHAISSASTIEECWQAILRASDEFGFAELQLRIGTRFYRERLKPIDPIACWTLRIPLSDSDYISFMRPVRSEFETSTVVPFVDLTRNALQSGLGKFRTREARSARLQHVAVAGE